MAHVHEHEHGTDLSRTVKDPVCGMDVRQEQAFAVRGHMGRKVYLCSKACAEKFDREPMRYAH